MCVSMYPAVLTETVGMVNLANHPLLGEVVVVGYQNRVANLAPGANAMILHFPASEGMTQENFLNTKKTPHILDDMADAIRVKSRGGDRSAKSLSIGGVTVFEYDIYTVALTRDPRLLREVLLSNLIPEQKRPDINEGLFDWYAKTKPGYSFAVCFFNNREAKKASPFLVYYKPRQTGFFEFPGLDAHTGEVPDESEMVDVDHTIVVGSYRMKGGNRVEYQDNIPASLQPFLPDRVVGRTYSTRMANGDFRYPAMAIENGSMDHMQRVW